MFNRSNNERPAYVVDAIPGARAALKAWEATLDTPAEAAAHRAHRVAIDAGNGKYIFRHGKAEPRNNTTHAEVDALLATLRTAEALAASFGTKTRSARASFERLFTAEAYSAAGVPAIAAAEALSLHAEAVEAWATLQRVLPERDHAHTLAGAPGLSWSAGPGGISSQQGGADWFYGQVLSAFKVEALEAVAGLGDFSPALRAQLSAPVVAISTPVPA